MHLTKTNTTAIVLLLTFGFATGAAKADGFTEASSWATYDAGANGVGTDPDGYNGAVFDGRYVYFAPYYKSAQMHGEVLRYDTQGQFDVPASWTTYDVKTNDPPGAKGGYLEAVFDGRYVYFAPHEDAVNNYQGEVLRYDTEGDFDVAASWNTFDAKTSDPPGAKGGYTDAVFDGRYVYFVPDRSDPTSFHGEVLRCDTQGAFDNASSWVIYEPAAHGVGDDATGYFDGVFDDQYIYFVPHRHPDYHGEVLRYDTTQEFTNALSWGAYDPGDNGVGDDPDGYYGGVFDGQYVYFAPYHNGTENHGEVLRYDMLADQGIPAVSEWGLVVMLLLLLTAGALAYAGRKPIRA